MEEKRNDKLRAQIQSLRSGNHSAILSTLKEFRVQGHISILPDLFDLLVEQESEEIITVVTSLLNDLKDQDGAELLSKAIANPEYRKVQTHLVAACWQNGLAYGKYIDTFTEVVITGEYSAAIEAFTVIEEAIGDLDANQRGRMVKRFKARLKEVDDEKKPLLIELVKVIESY